MTEVPYADTLPGGTHWSLVMRRHSRLKLIDLEGGANAGMLFYNAADRTERYCAPDTLKCQHTFRLTRGHCLYTDMGRVLCSIVEDTMGWHDTVAGNTTKAMVERRWGKRTFQEARNSFHRNGHDSFLIEAAKYGMQRRDLVSNVNWFSKVAVEDDGAMVYVTGASKAGAIVELRFEMDTLVLLHTCPHPLDPAETYPAKPVRYEISEGLPAADDDVCRHARPENARGFETNRIHHIGCGCGQA